MTAGPQPLVEELAADTGDLVQACLGSCHGTCLDASAILAVALAGAGIRTEAVHGAFTGRDHWWLEHDGRIIDATRRQFDDQPEVTAADDPAGPYQALRRYSAAWTPEQALIEFARMFELPGVGHQHARRILPRLRRRANRLSAAA